MEFQVRRVFSSLKDFSRNASTPPAREEGNYKSKLKFGFYYIDQGGVTYSFQDYKSHAANLVSPHSELEEKIETQILEYQEGKTFLTWFDLTSDISLKPDYVRVLSEMLSVSIMEVYYEEFDVDKTLIVVDNKLYSDKWHRCGFDSARTLFDRGRELEVSGRYRELLIASSKELQCVFSPSSDCGGMPFDRGK